MKNNIKIQKETGQKQCHLEKDGIGFYPVFLLNCYEGVARMRGEK